METSIVEVKMTDGSIAYNLVAIDGSDRIEIACVDKASALALQEAFLEHASYLTILVAA